MKKLLVLFVLIIGIFAYGFCIQTKYVNQIQKEYGESISGYFFENETTLELVKEYFEGSNVLVYQSNGTWNIKVNEKTLSILDLSDDIRSAIINLFEEKQIILFESLPDGFRFENQCDVDSISLNIIYVYETSKKSAFWDATYFLKNEHIYWLNENWYVSYGLKAR